jgi:hypothetical protein
MRSWLNPRSPLSACQQGAESPVVTLACAELGLDAVAGECILMFAKPTGVHKVHRWVSRLVGKLPA